MRKRINKILFVLNNRFTQIVDALADLPEETVIDGEVVALDESGRPDFHRLQHFTAEASRIHYFVLDLLILKGHDLTSLPLTERHKLLKSIKLRSGWISISEQFDISAADMVSAVREQGLEGVVAKRKDSLYEPGKRTGSWSKMRINKGQEFVIGGFVTGPHGVDSIIVGYYRGKDLIYVARVRNGFVPATRSGAYEELKPLVTDRCSFVNSAGDWTRSMGRYFGCREDGEMCLGASQTGGRGFVIQDSSVCATIRIRETWLRKCKRTCLPDFPGSCRHYFN